MTTDERTGVPLPPAGLGTAPLRIGTHCNTGSLACLGWGTALGVIRALADDRAVQHVVVDGDPPAAAGGPAHLLGARPSSASSTTCSPRNAATPFLISQGQVDAVVVGADRIAANGDVANKIGTYSLALAARQALFPFLVAAPESTIDPATPDGARITVEQRPEEEVTHVQGIPVAPSGHPRPELRVRHHAYQPRHRGGHRGPPDHRLVSGGHHADLPAACSAVTPSAAYT